MSFYYWIPNERPGIKLARLNELGLGYAVEDRFTARGCDSGPDGNKGIVVCHGDNKDGRLGYFAEEQVWRQCPTGEYFVGRYNDAENNPETLLRDGVISGRWITADDGSKWLAPLARKRFEEDGELFWTYNVPRRLTLDESGHWVHGDVKPRYQRLWADALECEQSVMDNAPVNDIDEIAVRAIQINYRVASIELDILGVYDETFRTEVIHTLIDLQTWMDWLKKKMPAIDGDNS